MRLETSIYLLGLTLAVTPFLSTAVLSAPAARATAVRSNQVILAAQPCPPGTYWEEGGYVSEGKWRDAHCAKDNGRQ